MPISSFYADLRQRLGTGLLLVPAVAAVIGDKDGRVLVQKRHDGSWSLPAGAVEPGETPAQAIRREVREETGLVVEPVRLLGVFGGEGGFGTRYANGDQVEYSVVLFDCQVKRGQLGGQDGESAGLVYFAAADIPPLATEYPRHLLLPGAPGGYFES
ncbi:MAG: NUDIX domain-containing protein [Candidatus Latescibacteria bacterium]|nr:NUDIX domain-containing protein [Candidatus Latescibacterota bacterium]